MEDWRCPALFLGLEALLRQLERDVIFEDVRDILDRFASDDVRW